MVPFPCPNITREKKLKQKYFPYVSAQLATNSPKMLDLLNFMASAVYFIKTLWNITWHIKVVEAGKRPNSSFSRDIE